MLRQIIIPTVCSVLFVTGCQTWPPQDPNRLPPTAALPETSQPGEVQVLYWNGLSGTTTNSLTTAPGFPDSPDTVGILNTLEGPTDQGDNYGSFVRGYIIPTETGLYTFYVSGDDQTAFWLSSSSDPSQKTKVAEVTGWTSPLTYSKYSSQRSPAQQMTAGQRYYFEIIHKEAAGGDHFSVAWEGPGISRAIVGGQNIASYAGETATGIGGKSDEESYRLGYSVGFLDGSQGLAFKPQFPPTDEDQDGIYDNWEVVYGLNPNDPSDASSDPDNDLLVAADEFLLGTAENNLDTDGDGIPDGAEFALELDPLDTSDAMQDLDGDGFSNLDEYLAETDLSDSKSMPEQRTELAYAQGFVGQYFDGVSFDTFLSARRDSAIQFSTGTDSFAQGQGSDNFSARWFGQFIAPHASGSRNYTFSVRVDDGARLFIDGNERISAWRDQGATTYSTTVAMQPQQSANLLMEYYERGGSAVAQFSITDQSTGSALDPANVVQSPDLAEAASTDSDDDGIPDTWELRNGLIPWRDDAGEINNVSGVTNLEAFNSDLSPWTLTSLASPESPTVDNGGSTTAPAPTPSSATLTWTAPLTRVDGTAISLSEIASYEISYGTSADNLSKSVTVDGSETSVEIADLSPGTWYFSIRVIDSSGLASAYSEVVSKEIQ